MPWGWSANHGGSLFMPKKYVQTGDSSEAIFVGHETKSWRNPHWNCQIGMASISFDNGKKWSVALFHGISKKLCKRWAKHQRVNEGPHGIRMPPWSLFQLRLGDIIFPSLPGAGGFHAHPWSQWIHFTAFHHGWRGYIPTVRWRFTWHWVDPWTHEHMSKKDIHLLQKTTDTIRFVFLIYTHLGPWGPGAVENMNGGCLQVWSDVGWIRNRNISSTLGGSSHGPMTLLTV